MRRSIFYTLGKMLANVGGWIIDRGMDCYNFADPEAAKTYVPLKARLEAIANSDRPRELAAELRDLIHDD